MSHFNKLHRDAHAPPLVAGSGVVLLRGLAGLLGFWPPWLNRRLEFPGVSPLHEGSRPLPEPCAVVGCSCSRGERPLGLPATFRAPRLPTARESAASAPTPPRPPAPPPPLAAASPGERARQAMPSRPVPVPGRGAAAPAPSLPQLPVP